MLCRRCLSSSLLSRVGECGLCSRLGDFASVSHQRQHDTEHIDVDISNRKFEKVAEHKTKFFNIITLPIAMYDLGGNCFDPICLR